MKRFLFRGFLRKRSERPEYEVKVLGSVLCSHPGADEICRAMTEKYTASRTRIDKIISQNMTVTANGIELEKGLTGSDGSLKKFVIERIVYSGVDKQHQKIFAFFYRAPDSLYGGLDCHVLECCSKRDAKEIALTFSELFQGIAEEKQKARRESSLNQLSAMRERKKSVSMMMLHSSVESLMDGSCPNASPKIEGRINSRTLNYSELQLHTTKCENSSGYGDSSDDLSNKIGSNTKHRKHKASIKTVQLNNEDRTQIGHVTPDYVNGEWSSLFERSTTSASLGYNSKIENETLLFKQIKEWDTTKKDKNDNSYKRRSKITVNQEYMNMKKIGSK